MTKSKTVVRHMAKITAAFCSASEFIEMVPLRVDFLFYIPTSQLEESMTVVFADIRLRRPITTIL